MECLGVYPQKVTFFRLSICECLLSHLYGRRTGRGKWDPCFLLYPGSLGHESGKRRTCCASRTGKWSPCTSASSSCSHEYCKVSIAWRTIPKNCERSAAISTDTKFGDFLECLRSWRCGSCKTWSHTLPRTWSLPTASCSGHLWPERRWPPFQEGHRSSSRGWTLKSSEKKRNQKVPQFQLNLEMCLYVFLHDCNYHVCFRTRTELLIKAMTDNLTCSPVFRGGTQRWLLRRTRRFFWSLLLAGTPRMVSMTVWIQMVTAGARQI